MQKAKIHNDAARSQKYKLVTDSMQRIPDNMDDIPRLKFNTTTGARWIPVVCNWGLFEIRINNSEAFFFLNQNDFKSEYSYAIFIPLKESSKQDRVEPALSIWVQ